MNEFLEDLSTTTYDLFDDDDDGATYPQRYTRDDNTETKYTDAQNIGPISQLISKHPNEKTLHQLRY